MLKNILIYIFVRPSNKMYLFRVSTDCFRRIKFSSTDKKREENVFTFVLWLAKCEMRKSAMERKLDDSCQWCSCCPAQASPQVALAALCLRNAATSTPWARGAVGRELDPVLCRYMKKTYFRSRNKPHPTNSAYKWYDEGSVKSKDSENNTLMVCRQVRTGSSKMEKT